MNRVLVTGGSGFIGTNLMEYAQSNQIDSLNYDWKAPRNSALRSSHKAGDILDLDHLKKTFADFRPDVVIHLAARCDLAGMRLEDYEANTTGVANIVKACLQTSSVERVVFASSRYVHRNEGPGSHDEDYSPFTLYGLSKAEGEKLVRRSNLPMPWTIIRPTSIWGPWFEIPYKGFFQAVRRGLYVHPRGERIYKTYGYVGNVVHQMMKLVESDPEVVSGKTLYTADYTPIEVSEMAERIRHHFQAPPIRQVPLPLMRTLALGGDLLKRLGFYNPPLSTFRLNNLRVQMVYDMSATLGVCGPLPNSMDRGVGETTEWMKRNP